MAPPRVLVTRAAYDAARWVAALQHQGIVAQALPLMAITALCDAQLQHALQQARAHSRDYRALMFVSSHAVQYFFESKEVIKPNGQALSAIKTRCWAPGPGTVRALRAHQVAAALIDGPATDAGQFDSETLWRQVAPQVRPGDRVLIVRGTDQTGQPGGKGRNWLATQIELAGAQVDFVASYERTAPEPDEQALALAQAAARDGTVWLFSSSEAIAHLRGWLPAQDWSAAHALATHPRIAQAARHLGFGQVTSCRPTPEDVAASIESAV